MQRLLASLIIGITAVFFPIVLFAQTACDGTPMPSSECPSGSSMTCVQAPDGTSRWECVAEAPGTPPADPVADPVAEPAVTTPTESVPTSTTPEPAPATTSTSAPALEAASTTTEAPSGSTAAPTAAPQQPAASEQATPVSLEDVQALVDAAADEAPPALQPWLSAIAGALAMLVAVLGFLGLQKKIARKGTKPCPHCSGKGYEKAPASCERCGGTGKIEEEVEPTAECAHCEGSGEEPCEECEGTGAVEGTPCGSCDGKGTKQDENKDGFDCSVCGGEGEASATLTRQVTCPDCGGTGR